MLHRRQFLSLSATGFLLIPAMTARAMAAAAPLAQEVAALGPQDLVLEKQIEALITQSALKKVGFAAVDLKNGRSATFREGELFSAQGVNMIAVALSCCRQAEKQKINLSEIITLKAADISPGRSPIADRVVKKPTQFTVEQLVDHVLLNGDTTAADALLKLAGGPAIVQAQLATIGLDAIRVDRYERELHPEAMGFKPSPNWSVPGALEAAWQSLEITKKHQAIDAHLRNPRDSISPKAMATLLLKLASGQLLDLRQTERVRDLLTKTQLGQDRIKAGLPKGWNFAHRAFNSRSVENRMAIYSDSGFAWHKKRHQIVMSLFIEDARVAPARLAGFSAKLASTVMKAWT